MLRTFSLFQVIVKDTEQEYLRDLDSGLESLSGFSFVMKSFGCMEC